LIQSFRDRDTEKIFHGEHSKRFQQIETIALRKLLYLHRSRSLQDLAAVPGHRLESLRGDRKGEHSIRINKQYRICFRWQGTDAHDVEITDYH
jgi:proteic killer suppression protein